MPELETTSEAKTDEWKDVQYMTEDDMRMVKACATVGKINIRMEQSDILSRFPDAFINALDALEKGVKPKEYRNMNKKNKKKLRQ